MNHDISACNSCIGKIGNELQYCPLSEDCLRYKLFRKFKEKEGKESCGIWMVVAGYKDGKCELQIKMKDEEENQKNG